MSKRSTKKFNRAFEDALRESGATIRCMWQMDGPENTMVSGLEMLACYGEAGAFTLALVVSYAAHDGTPEGWDVFTPASQTNRVDATLAAVEAAMRANIPAKAEG
jgi:hypothetical protein